MAKFRVLGRALPREDGWGKVTGEAHFTADVIRPDMLWGKILRSPLAHDRIVKIYASRARSLPGVKAVITAQDVSPKLTGRTLADLPILARDRVRFVGDKVAAVAAIDKDTAEEALSLIDVVYEELSAVFDPLEALKPEAPLIHPDYASYEAPETKALSCATCRACCARKRAMSKRLSTNPTKSSSRLFKPRWCIKATSSLMHAPWRSTARDACRRRPCNIA